MSDQGSVSSLSGLTAAEERVMDASVALWEAWSQLPAKDADDTFYVHAAVHRVQDVLAVRAAARAFPKYWRRIPPCSAPALTPAVDGSEPAPSQQASPAVPAPATSGPTGEE